MKKGVSCLGDFLYKGRKKYRENNIQAGKDVQHVKIDLT